MRTPRRAGVLAAVAAAAALGVGGATAAGAAPAAPAKPASFCPAAPSHGTPNEGTSGQCVIKISVTIYVDGQPLTFTAYYFLPFENGSILLHSTGVKVGSFTSNANGVATGTITIPQGFPVGQHTIELKGDDGTDLTTNFTVVAPSSTTTGTGTGSTGGGTLPFTGADVAGLAGGGAALIVGGALLTVVFRRRRTTPAA